MGQVGMENEICAGIPLGGNICAGTPCLGVFYPLAMSMGGSFGPGKIGLGGVGVFGGGEGLETKFGQGLPCMEAFFV